ncbi:centrosomal protein POC5-like [Clytia hemisphaerica]|uniref:Centrosomal protein POC5 n=1 Tax=Clytia hemisphaerica TaxID=252671 RepID=A0A7M5V8V4_9CNID
MSTITDGLSSLPDGPDEVSRGSSVSSGFINEYEQILKFAIVAPKLNLDKKGFKLDKDGSDQNKETGDSEGAFESDSSNTSTSSATSPTPFETGKSIHDGNLEIKVIEAKKAVNKMYRTKRIDHTKQQQVSKAMETLLETPKEPNRTLQRKVESNGSSPESLAGDVPSPSIDKDLIRMDNAMNDWCLQLKRNVLNELADMKKKQLLYQEQILDQMQSKHNAEHLHSTHEMESMKELLYTFEQSVKQKDEVIANLTSMLGKQKERSEKIRIFSVWRLKHNDERRQVFAQKMAEKFYKRSLMNKVWIGWRSVVENTWKRRVEKACQIKSQEICLKLTEDYEERLQALQQELAGARAEIAKMHTERDCYEENMKKAFMRGVCALNMEAMSMFKEGQEEEDSHQAMGSRDQQFAAPPLRGTNPQHCLNGVQQNGQRTNGTRGDIHNHQQQTTVEMPLSNVCSASSSKKKVHFNNPSMADSRPSSRNSVTGTGINGSAGQRKNIHVKMTGKKEYGTLKKTSGSQSSTISSIKVERHSQPATQHSQQPIPRPSSKSSQPHSRSNTPSNFMKNTSSRKPAFNSVVVE